MEFDARAFGREVAAGGTVAADALNGFVDLAQTFEKSASQSLDVVRAYLDYRPAADEIMQTIDPEMGLSGVAAAHALKAIVSSHAGIGFRRDLLRVHSRRLYAVLTKDRGRMARLVLELLTVMSKDSVPFSREIVGRIHFGSKELLVLVRTGTSTRAAFLGLFAALLVCCDPNVVTGVTVKARKIIVAILQDFAGNGSPTSQKQLRQEATSEQKFLRAYSISLRSLPHPEPFRNAVQEPIFGLLVRIACIHSDPRVRAVCSELLAACASKPPVTRKEDVASALVSVAVALNSPNALNLISSTLRSRPQATEAFLRDPRLLVREPKLTLNWIGTMAVLVTALSTPLPDDASPEDAIPTTFFKQSGLDKALVHSEKLLRLTTFQVTVAALHRLAETLKNSPSTGAKLDAFLPNVNTITAAVKLALAEGGLAAALGLELIHLYLWCNTSSLAENRVDVAKLAFSEPSLIPLEGGSPLAAPASSLLATDKLLRLTRHLAETSPTHLFTGRGGGGGRGSSSEAKKLSRFGTVLLFYAQNRNPVHEPLLSELCMELFLATNMFPASCAAEIPIWLDSLSSGRVSATTLAIIDEFACEATKKPYILIDDVVMAARGGQWTRVIRADDLPFSPLLAAALRRMEKIWERPDDASTVAVRELREVLLLCLRAQSEFRPLSWLIREKLGRFYEDPLVRTATSLWTSTSIPHELRELVPVSLEAIIDAARRARTQQKVERSGPPNGETVQCGMTQLRRRWLAMQPPELASRRALFQISLVTQTKSAGDESDPALALLLDILAEVLPLCDTAAVNHVLQNQDLVQILRSGKRLHRCLVGEILQCGAGLPIALSPYVEILAEHIESERADDLFLAWTLSMSGLAPVTRRSLLQTALKKLGDKKLDDVSRLIDSLVHGNGPAESIDDVNVPFELLNRWLLSSVDSLDNAVMCFITAEDPLLRCTAILVAEKYHEVLVEKTFSAASTLRSRVVATLVPKIPCLFPLLLNKLQNLTVRNSDEHALLRLVPVAHAILDVSDDDAVLHLFDRLYMTLLVADAVHRRLTPITKAFFESILLKSSMHKEASARKLSRIVKCLASEAPLDANDLRVFDKFPVNPDSEHAATTVWTSDKWLNGSECVDRQVLLRVALHLRGRSRSKRCAEALAVAILAKCWTVYSGTMTECLAACEGLAKSRKKIVKRVGTKGLRTMVTAILRSAPCVKEHGALQAAKMLDFLRAMLQLFEAQIYPPDEAIDRLCAHSSIQTSLSSKAEGSRTFVASFCRLLEALLVFAPQNCQAKTAAQLLAETIHIGCGDDADQAILGLLKATGYRSQDLSRGLLGDSIIAIESVDVRRIGLIGAKSDEERQHSQYSILLRTACQALARAGIPNTDEIVDLRQFVDSGLLGISFRAFSSEDESVRKLGYACAELVYDLICDEREKQSASASLFRERKLLLFLLKLIRDSVSEELTVIPGVVACFLELIAPIVIRPAHELFPLVMRFLLRQSSLSLDDAMFFTFLVHGDDPATLRKSRLLALRVLQLGARSRADHEILKHRHIYEQLMVLVVEDALYTDVKVRRTALETLTTLAKQTFNAATELVRKHGILTWLVRRVRTPSAALTKDSLRLLATACQNIRSSRERTAYSNQAGAALGSLCCNFLAERRTLKGNSSELAVQALAQAILAVTMMTPSHRETFTLGLRDAWELYELLKRTEVKAVSRDMLEWIHCGARVWDQFRTLANGESKHRRFMLLFWMHHQALLLLGYARIVRAPSGESAEGLYRVAQVCFAECRIDREQKERSVLRTTESAALAAAGTSLVCELMTPEEIRSMPPFLRWALASALRSAVTPTSSFQRVVLPAALRAVLHSELYPEDRTQLDACLTRVPSPANAIREFAKTRIDSQESAFHQRLSLFVTELLLEFRKHGLEIGMPSTLSPRRKRSHELHHLVCSPETPSKRSKHA